MKHIEIQVHESRRYVAIWLTRSESRDDATRASLLPIFAEWSRKKYKIVVFESGERDLVKQTQALLAHTLETTAHTTSM